MTPFTPFSLGNYLCQEVISTGGCGDLYQAIHLPSNGRRAIRLLGTKVIDNPDALETILQTLFRIKVISHPNIITIHEIIRRDYQIFIVMDFIEGFSLQQIFSQLRTSDPLSTEVASFITWQICQALYYAHNLNVEGRPAPLLHGALWPNNILVGLNGEVRLTDFNNWVVPIEAYGLDDAALNSLLSYRSPEHLLQGNLTHSSDLFCVGVLFHQMLTGLPLFQGPATVETIERVKGAELRHALDTIPANLQPILRRCLEQDPHQRFSDVAAFISELALEVLGVGGQRVREDLVSFLSTHMTIEDEEETGSLPRPAPLPGSREDEITAINPADMTHLLVALSRERTDGQLHVEPLPTLQHQAEGTEEIESSQIESEESTEGAYESEEIEDEATIVESMTPSSLVNTTSLEDNAMQADDTSVTHFDEVALHHERAPERPSPGAQPIPSALFPPREEDPGEHHAPLQQVPTDTITTRAERPLQFEQRGPAEDLQTLPPAQDSPLEWETPPIDNPQAAFRQDDIPTYALKKSAESGSEQDNLTLTPLPLPSETPASSRDIFSSGLPAPASLPENPPQETYTSEEVTAGSPITANLPILEQLISGKTPDQGRAETLHDLSRNPHTLDTPAGTPSPENQTEPIHSAVEELPGQQEQGSPREAEGTDVNESFIDEGSASFNSSLSSDDGGLSSYDGMSRDEAPWDGPSAVSKVTPRATFTAAHLLLIVAIIIFVVALTLLVRRLYLQAPAPAAVATDVLRPPSLDSALRGAPRPQAPQPDQRPPKPPLDMAPPPKDARPSKQTTGSREAGKHLDKLLHGQATAGQLQIDSTPPGMAFVSGKPVGMTPVIAKPGSGKKVPVVILAKGFKMFRQVVVTSTQKALRINTQLSPAGYPRAAKKPRGILNVICHHKDRRQIFINGESTGFACPKVGFFLKPGRYKIGVYTVKRDRYRNFTVRVPRNRRRILKVPR